MSTRDFAWRTALSTRLRITRDTATGSPINGAGEMSVWIVHPALATHPSRLDFSKIAKGHLLFAQHQALFVGAGQQKQIFDQRAHPVRLGEQGVDRQLRVE